MAYLEDWFQTLIACFCVSGLIFAESSIGLKGINGKSNRAKVWLLILDLIYGFLIFILQMTQLFFVMPPLSKYKEYSEYWGSLMRCQGFEWILLKGQWRSGSGWYVPCFSNIINGMQRGSFPFNYLELP